MLTSRCSKLKCLLSQLIGYIMCSYSLTDIFTLLLFYSTNSSNMDLFKLVKPTLIILILFWFYSLDYSSWHNSWMPNITTSLSNQPCSSCNESYILFVISIPNMLQRIIRSFWRWLFPDPPINLPNISIKSLLLISYSNIDDSSFK